MQVAKPFNVPLLFIEPPFFRGFSRAARMHFLRRGWLYCHALSQEQPAPAMPAMQPPRTGRKRKDACSFSLSACALVVAWGVRESCVRTGSGCFAKGMAVSPCREVVFARRKLVAPCRADLLARQTFLHSETERQGTLAVLHLFQGNRHAVKIFCQALKIFCQGRKKFFQALEIFFQAWAFFLKIISCAVRLI